MRRGLSRPARALVGILGSLAASATAAGEPSPCLVASRAPAHAFVGEQIVLEIRVLRRPDVSSASWLDGGRFPGFRSDPLPGLSGETRVHENGAAYLVFSERHALFAVRPGRLSLPAARLQCAVHSLPGTPPRAFIAQLEPRSIDVVAVPAQGRPPGYAGLVGQVTVTVHADPLEVRVGETLRLTVSYEGDADLRSLPPPFDGARTLGAAELFAARPKLALEPGTLLRLRRIFAFDVVPREPGTLTVPAVLVPHFDPATKRYGVAEAPPVEIRVNPAGEG